MSNEKDGKSLTSGEDQTGSNATSGANENDGKGREEFVAYQTYKKAVTELNNNKTARKDLESQLAEYREREESAEKKRLEEQGEYKKLLELERKRNDEYLRERDEYKTNLVTAHKLNAFKEKLPGRLRDPEYYTFVDVDNIAIDPETNTIDDTSVEATVSNFMSKHSCLVEGTGKKLPNDAPQNRDALTYENWKKLPIKERRARLHEVTNKE